MFQRKISKKFHTFHGRPTSTAMRQQARQVNQEADEQRGAHDGVQAALVKQPGRDADGETARAQRSERHHVEGLPDAPWKSVAQARGRAQTGDLPVDHQDESHSRSRPQQKVEVPGAHGNAEHRHAALPPDDCQIALGLRRGTHIWGINPVFLCSSSIFDFVLAEVLLELHHDSRRKSRWATGTISAPAPTIAASGSGARRPEALAAQLVEIDVREIQDLRSACFVLAVHTGSR